MKNILLLLGLLLFLTACQNSADEMKKKAEATTAQITKTIDYPEAMNKVFDNHGSLAKWKSQKTMSYEIVKEDGNEKQLIDLQNRWEKIEAPSFISGYDGKEYWVEADTTYKGNPKFYTNLMFYFYAMPFVLADEGINYDKTEAITFDGVTYPGYRISYGDNVGVSPEDEYFIYYHPESYEMAWLGYTVTYFSGEPSKKISYIRYHDWKNFNGLKLPNSLTWYKVEDSKITEPRNTREFANVAVSDQVTPNSTFVKTAGARVVE